MTEQTTGMEQPGAGLPVSQNKKWDWRVIVLELLIVFVGLFAALQLDSYRDQQEFRAAQHRHLLRLSEDLSAYIEGTDGTVSFLKGTEEAVQHVVDSLNAGEILNGDEALFEKGVIYFAHLPSSALPRTSYQEMVASGMFSALESEDLKKQVSSLFALQDFANSNFIWWRETAIRFEEEMASHVDYYSEAPAKDKIGFMIGEPDRRIRYNFNELASNRRVRNGFYWAQDVVWDWAGLFEELNMQARQVNDLIQQQLNLYGENE